MSAWELRLLSFEVFRATAFRFLPRGSHAPTWTEQRRNDSQISIHWNKNLESKNFPRSVSATHWSSRGAFAIVYLCENKQGKDFAVKVINKGQASAQKEALETEVKIMWDISGHPNIVKLVDLFEDAGSIYMVLEL